MSQAESEVDAKESFIIPPGSIVKIGGIPYEVAGATVVLGYQQPQWLTGDCSSDDDS